MKLTRASSYAIVAVANIAAHKPTGAPIASHLIAKKAGIPERFLLKVLKPLVSNGTLISLKGPNGGYRLAKPASKITMLQVVEGVDGVMRGGLTWEPKGALGKNLASACEEMTNSARKIC